MAARPPRPLTRYCGGVRIRRRDLLQKFFADRGPHLAAMIAYFALLSFVPLLFISLVLLSTAGQANEGSFFVRELHRTFVGTPEQKIHARDRSPRGARVHGERCGNSERLRANCTPCIFFPERRARSRSAALGAVSRPMSNPATRR